MATVAGWKSLAQDQQKQVCQHQRLIKQLNEQISVCTQVNELQFKVAEQAEQLAGANNATHTDASDQLSKTKLHLHISEGKNTSSSRRINASRAKTTGSSATAST